MLTGASENSGVRLLTVRELPAALQLSSLAGWNQTAAEWQLLLEVASDSCFCIAVGGVLAATATLIPYGSRLGWIGMVLTHPEFRKRGFARRLLTHCVGHADALGIRTLKLDATEQGQHLYESLGFVPEQTVERWIRSCPPSRERPVSITGKSSLALADDALAFGADRSQLLERLSRHSNCFAAANSYLLSRTGRIYRYLGPCVARDLKTANQLFQLALGNSSERECAWDFLANNHGAKSLAEDLGFGPHRRLLRMSRGEQLRSRDDLIYAIAGFEFG
ncbi:MAG: GNAT family N-acetyltransferase [Acidobacteriales bacterium]|nr:GNAT family N-acetyltransferase [Terriglobales bacterium]